MELTSSLVPEIKAGELLCHVSFLEFWPWPFIACLILMFALESWTARSSHTDSCAKAHVASTGKSMSWGREEAWKGGNGRRVSTACSLF